MGGGPSSLSAATFGTRLTAEELEELRVLSGLRPPAIVSLYLEYATVADADLAAARRGEGPPGGPPAAGADGLSLAGFYRLRFVAHCPLREQLAVLYGYATTGTVLSFREFLLASATFSPAAPRDARAAALFRLYDADGDGRISRDDLLFVLSKTVSFEAGGSGHVLDPLMMSGGAVAGAARKAPRSTKLTAVADRVLAEASSAPDKSYLTRDDFVRVSRQVDAFDHRSCVVTQ
jgi:hypothetical protein